jgi:hypothetical protein
VVKVPSKSVEYLGLQRCANKQTNMDDFFLVKYPSSNPSAGVENWY